VMDQGHIRQIGPPSEVYEFPNSKFVAGFIGSINMVEGVVKQVNDKVVEVDTPSLKQKLSIHANTSFSVGEEVSVAFRPEKISISLKKPSGALNVVKGQVQDFGYFGKDSLYRIKLATGHILSVNTVNAQRLSEGENAVSWDDEVFLTLDPKAIMVFKGDA